ncbi:ADP-ribose pyrophosphatase YjhB (NUDIX family) [Halanaerobium saccharolyticum]|uniref:ADP-ribose pyrophosphatase YjhB (NUDIX family) n=1 Tax=Halanaerobium saccharolyticum TaxID=43595 RepID=A0A4R7YMT2_9FIRM|nr:NUDIX hydrolase [Halanaerobium saccharolyticum]RAK04154.1 ADP-ribose pyrophosphatase YjhB (NUDIX family) [Halanaerobium saccharolyticum]TDV97949.1 ADP-ribose pyrophosphatase YjhB (NUDIX family) [Halanaerobium saccharolyticum]TDX51010.1 ADP-ribose pyrophosphatase YjhB (NUDIX family) [Halanaerobium saccharolyticum]
MNYFQKILEEIKKYKPESQAEKKYKKQILNFLVNNKENYLRTNPKGHLTASAWIINRQGGKVLLHHHQALDKWIQLGGHLERGELIQEAALREAIEESGLNSLSVVKHKIFDLDVHKIPANNSQAEHFHYDIRYLLEADSKVELVKSSESVNLKWLQLNEIEKYVCEESVLRMMKKTKKYKEDY